jgi:hypothetical protein
MHRLAQALISSDDAMLQTLSDTALNLCEAGSAGIGLLEREVTGAAVFRWVAVSGECNALVGTTTPADESPSGVTLEFATGQLFSFPKRHFECLKHVAPEVIEELVVPIPGTREPWGTLWVMSHDRRHPFDAEDRRILTTLARFTCATLTITRAKADAEARAAEAEAARNALALAEARKDDFIATLSHELRNPIAPVDSALETIRKLSADFPAVLSALNIADRQMRLLKRLVSDLLDASRIKHGKLSLHPSYGLLQDIVADAVTAMKSDVHTGQHDLHVTVPPYPVTVHADLIRLMQVVCNLLSNAVKYTPPRRRYLPDGGGAGPEQRANARRVAGRGGHYSKGQWVRHPGVIATAYFRDVCPVSRRAQACRRRTRNRTGCGQAPGDGTQWDRHHRERR